MHDNPQKPELVSSSTDQENSFTVSLEEVNSAFGISSETLKALAASHGISPEALLVRAATTWALADIPDLDLDVPRLTAAQLEFLQQRRNAIDAIDAAATRQPTTLVDTFKRLIEGGQNHENAESSPRNGGHR